MLELSIADVETILCVVFVIGAGLTIGRALLRYADNELDRWKI